MVQRGQTRGKRSLHSALDDIEGVGPQLKRALVRHFSSVAAIREADIAALTTVKGIGEALAIAFATPCVVWRKVEGVNTIATVLLGGSG